MESTLDVRNEGSLNGSHDIFIYYEDTDLSGFVYHANYLKFFERAREHLIGVSFLRDLYVREGLHFVVNKAQMEFKSPARHGDILRIESIAQYSRSPALPFTQNAYVLEEGGQPRLAVSAQITIVALNLQNRPIRMPDLVIETFHRQNLASPKAH